MPAKRPPVPLTPERIVDAALHLANGQGLRRLTMRRLGDALSAEAMAIYHHFPGGKDALFQAMADRVTAVEVPESDDWRERVRAWCRASRTALLDHPGVLSLATTRPPRGAGRALLADQRTVLEDEAGLSPERAAEAVRTLRAYVLGSSAIELAEESADDQAFERGLEACLRGLDIT